MIDRPFLDFEGLIAATVGSLVGLDVLDLGSGSGRMSRRMAALGARVTGIEPNAEQVQIALADGGATYVVASAAHTGLGDASFDLAVFSYSLHHVPVADMPRALTEAKRLLRPSGRILVVEPVADDPLYPAMCFIDDERPVYDKALAVMAAAVENGTLSRISTQHCRAKYRTDSPQAMIDKLTTIDGSRRLASEDRAAFEAAWQSAAEQDAVGTFIETWERADVFNI